VKCVRCGHDSKYKERSGQRCPGCRGEFAFEPQKKDPVTDAAFQAAIDAVSASGRVRWGVEHLHYEIARRRRIHRAPLAFRIFLFVVGMLVGTVILGWVLGLIVAAVAAVGLPALIWGLASPTLTMTTEEFNRLWKRWQQAHGSPKGVIVRRSHPTGPRSAEPDLADYSFDRAVICDRARTVDLLVANNFHFENNCAVLSVGGYPPGPFETIRAMLRRNPRLQVFVLHDATAAGCRLAHRLTTSPEWFQHLPGVTDVGLRPAHAGPFKGLYLPSPSGPVLAGDGITAKEAVWLSDYALELAAIRPEQVIKRLFKALNRPSDQKRDGADSDSTTWHDTSSFSSDASDSDGGDDAFG
jgi:DNA-directed RNA polymerase subunit RPC12/RpoP